MYLSMTEAINAGLESAPMSTSDVYRDAHTEAVALGGPAACPFDCAACERAMMRHDHPAACGHPVTCDDESCLWDERLAPVVACDACTPAPVPYAHTCPVDPWSDGIPF